MPSRREPAGGHHVYVASSEEVRLLLVVYSNVFELHSLRIGSHRSDGAGLPSADATIRPVTASGFQLKTSVALELECFEHYGVGFCGMGVD